MYFIGNFQHLTNQKADDEKERRHGEFSMIVAADTVEQAMDMFRRRLVSFRESSSFFEGHCTIYITQLLEFDQMPQEEAVVLNFKSFAGDPLLPFIACVVPSEQNNACSIHDWHDNQPTTEGRQDSIFIEFE